MKNDDFKSSSWIYGHSNLWKLSLKVILTSLSLSLLLGIYIFADQMIIIKLVPTDGVNYLKQYFASVNQLGLFNQVFEYVTNQINTPNYLPEVEVFNERFISFVANQLGIFSLIALSLGSLISAGASILFSKSFAKKDGINNKSQIISTSFYSSLLIGIILVIIMTSIQNYILKSMQPSINENAFTTNEFIDNKTLFLYAKTYYEAVVYQASRYTYFVNANILFICITSLFVFLLRAEGKIGVVTVIGLSCNVLNILLDLLLIVVFRVGVIGGGIATFVGQLVNLLFIFLYLVYLNKNNLTEITFQNIFKFNYDWRVFGSSISLGSASFIRESTLAIANVVYVGVFVNTLQKINSAALTSYGSLNATTIYNLFLLSIFGIVDGLRPIISFNYYANKHDRVVRSYWIALIFSLIYSLIVILLTFLVVCLSDNVKEFLNAKNAYDKKNLLILLTTLMLQFPFISLSVGGFAFFQSTDQKIWNIVLATMQTIIVFYPTLFINSKIAEILANDTLMVFTGFISISISSLIIFVITLIYLQKLKNKKVNNLNL